MASSSSTVYSSFSSSGSFRFIVSHVNPSGSAYGSWRISLTGLSLSIGSFASIFSSMRGTGCVDQNLYDLCSASSGVLAGFSSRELTFRCSSTFINMSTDSEFVVGKPPVPVFALPPPPPPPPPLLPCSSGPSPARGTVSPFIWGVSEAATAGSLGFDFTMRSRSRSHDRSKRDKKGTNRRDSSSSSSFSGSDSSDSGSEDSRSSSRSNRNTKDKRDYKRRNADKVSSRRRSPSPKRAERPARDHREASSLKDRQADRRRPSRSPERQKPHKRHDSRSPPRRPREDGNRNRRSRSPRDRRRADSRDGKEDARNARYDEDSRKGSTVQEDNRRHRTRSPRERRHYSRERSRRDDERSTHRKDDSRNGRDGSRHRSRSPTARRGDHSRSERRNQPEDTDQRDYGNRGQQPQNRWMHDMYESHDSQRNADRSYRRSNRDTMDDDFMQSRRLQREIIGTEGVPEAWGDSPSEPNSSDDELAPSKGGSGKHKSKGKEKKKASKHSKSKKEKKKKKSSKKSKKSKSSKKKKKRKNKKAAASSSSASESESSSSDGDGEEEVWIEKSEALARTAAAKGAGGGSAGASGGSRARSVEEDGDNVVGPVKTSGNLSQKDFGRALLPGEGAAMAAYVTEGKRIPRRGEIGLTSDEIANFEQVGYVMSGSRHRRMEAVRIRKENQIYSADEKRALAMFSKEERQKRENKILTQFKEMITAKLSENKNLICFWLVSITPSELSICFSSSFISVLAVSTTRHSRANVLDSSLRERNHN
uniref:NF-kappa-B-activating protein C-terminal domain-containing protein n=1 Tax=Anopheles farauti TaxID=69004 RepID=A0A182QLP5_9DIPT